VLEFYGKHMFVILFDCGNFKRKTNNFSGVIQVHGFKKKVSS